MTTRLTISLAAAVVLTACGSGATDPTDNSPTSAQAGNAAPLVQRAMWITGGSCGPQNLAASTFKTGDIVYLNGSGYRDALYGWSILGAEFGQSTDQGVIVAGGTIRFAEGQVRVTWTTGTPGTASGGAGSFCFAAYTIPSGDLGKYYAFVGGVKSSYKVEAGGQLAVTVAETATATATRLYGWAIQLSANPESVVLHPKEQREVRYTATLTSWRAGIEYAVSGTITITNTGTLNAVVQSVGNTRSVADGAKSNVVCSSLPVTLPPGGTLTCTHLALVPHPVAGNSRATVAISEVGGGNAKAIQSGPVSYGSTGFTEGVRGFSVRVADDRYGALGVATAGATTTTYTYSLTIHAPHETDHDCGVQPNFRNTVTYTAEDGPMTGKAERAVGVTVMCPIDCNRTAAYWKTHSKYGPEPYDKAWAGIGEDHAFFSTGKTWYQMFWLPVEGTNRYVALAHQFMAAFLNHLAHGNDAVPAAALADATALLQAYQLGTVPSHAWAQFDAVTATLRDYNEGRLGVGACAAAD